MTAPPNQASDVIDTDRGIRTKWLARRMVRYGWSSRTTLASWLIGRGRSGHSVRAIGDREQRHDRGEHEHEVAMDVARVAQVAREDDDEDQDERDLERDVDGVHGSLGYNAT